MEANPTNQMDELAPTISIRMGMMDADLSPYYGLIFPGSGGLRLDFVINLCPHTAVRL